MTEAEWLWCEKPNLMLNHLRRQFGHKALRRKHRLFICACCRLFWNDLMTDSACRKTVESAERYADGQALKAERDTARWALWPDRGHHYTRSPQGIARLAFCDGV